MMVMLFLDPNEGEIHILINIMSKHKILRAAVLPN